MSLIAIFDEAISGCRHVVVALEAQVKLGYRHLLQ